MESPFFKWMIWGNSIFRKVVNCDTDQVALKTWKPGIAQWPGRSSMPNFGEEIQGNPNLCSMAIPET